MTIESTSLRQRPASRAAHRFTRTRSALRCTPLALALACGAGVCGEVFAHDAAVAGAILWPVTNCNDAGPESLRDAFASAGDGDEIDLTQLTCSTITLTSGALASNAAGSITIRADPANPTTIDGNGADRVIERHGGGLETYHLHITGGRYHGASGGGCIYSQSGLRLHDTHITDCEVSTTGTVAAYGGAVLTHGRVFLDGGSITGSAARAAAANSGGGAIWADLDLNLFASTISGNVASGDGTHVARGGGVFANFACTIDYSTIADNRADTGGGVFIVGGASLNVRIDNSTISGNEANAWAGGLMVAAASTALSIRSSTITGNRVPGGSFGGAYLAGAATVDGTILAGNTVSDGLQDSDLGGAAGTTITGANNLIRASSLPVPEDTITLDPKLGPLQDNGGGTATHALLAGSPAIDHGSNVGERTADQRLNDARGHVFTRVVGSSADIGAFEFGADRIFANDFE
jgi:hypothetical protein